MSDTNKNKTDKRFGFGYLSIGVFTFGHSWVFSPVPPTPTGPPPDIMFQVIASFASSVFWPLYWTVKLFQLFEQL